MKRDSVSFCAKCGRELPSDAVYCPYCGVPVHQPSRRKNKNTAVMLAVSLSSWTWLYTYKRDAWKFWSGFGIGTVSVALIFLYTVNMFEDAMNLVDQAMSGSLTETQLTVGASVWTVWGIIATIALFGIWVWAIVDTAIKNAEWYNSYYAKAAIDRLG